MQPVLWFPQWLPGPRPFGADQRKRGSLAGVWIGVKQGRNPGESATCAGLKACQRTAMAASRAPRIAGPPPDMAMLNDAGLAYLARYAATELSLRRVLERRIERWARLAGGSDDPESIAERVAVAREAVRAVVAKLAAAGAVNDTAYAESRALSLGRAGRSRRAVTAHLAAKGVSSEIARAVVRNDDASELAAALVLARRRRLGPFRVGAKPDAAGYRRELAVLARAGFPQAVASQALSIDPRQAEALVNQFRR
jgi:regulatory protein